VLINKNEDFIMHTYYETDRLIITTLNEEAAPMVLSFYEDNKTHFEPWEPKRGDNFYTFSYQKASLTAEQHQMSEGKLFRYWVFLKNNPKEVIGSVCFHNLLKEPYHSCSLGYKISHNYLHQGYALESIGYCINLMFETHNIHRIDAFIMPDNTPSRRLIEKLSFLYEGVAASFARIGGSWCDHRHYALINPRERFVLPLEKASPNE
jgi:ribosomal-protein-alanine N-acetyltransferase